VPLKSELFLGVFQTPDQSPSGNGRITISDATGPAATVPQVERAITTAHELFGHALLFLRGTAFKHDDKGPVDGYIQRIEDRTRALYE